MIGRVAPALLALGLLGACSTTYPTPVIEPVQGTGPQEFAGLRELMDRPEGLRVLWTHGMCTHSEAWVADRANRVSIALGLGPLVQDLKPARKQATQGRDDDSYTLPQRFTVDGRTMDIDYFVWSPIFAAAKAALDFDAPGGTRPGQRPTGKFRYDRAELNNTLKVGLMNDCLADAVLYNGKRAASTTLRARMREAVCTALGGRMSGVLCDVGGATDARPVVFVTESLGSKFLFDAVRDLWDASESRPVNQAALGARLANVRMLFMLANQIPLLDLADADADAGPTTTRVGPAGASPSATPSSMGRFLDILSKARRTPLRVAPLATAPAPIADPLTVVAFTDPNDLLSYRLLVSEMRLVPDAVRLFNVIASNAPVYFGLVERPDTAHCGYAFNAYVVGLLVQGHHPGAKLPSAPVTGTGSCF